MITCFKLVVAALQLIGLTCFANVAAQSQCSVAENLCPENTFCNFNVTDISDPSIEQRGSCQPCLDHPMACTIPQFTNDLGQVDCINKCTKPKICSDANPCSDVDEFFCNYYHGDADGEETGQCETCVGMGLQNTTDECFLEFMGLPEKGMESCAEYCSIKDRECDENTRCPYGMFCNYSNGLDGSEVEVIESSEDPWGHCKYCKWHLQFCFIKNLSPRGLAECLISCDNFSCTEWGEASLSVNGFAFDALHVAGTPFVTSIKGRLVDFGFSFGESVTDLDLNGVESPVCLIERGGTFYHRKLTACESRGGVAAIIFNDIPDEPLYAQLFSNEVFNTNIPAVTLRGVDGLELREKNIGDTATISTWSVGNACIPDCSDDIECPENMYCDYDYNGNFGSCHSCDEHAEDCYFSDWNLKGAESCANTCGSKLEFPECKLCGRDVSIENLQNDADGDVCQFCPGGIAREYQNTPFPLFGDETRCIDLERYFTRYYIPQDARNCELAIMYNFICGCEGPGYMKANNEAKRNSLVWLPRVTSIISFFGSSIIVYDILVKDKRKQKKMNHQMMLVLSIFDLFGSIAYSLTTLPMPKEDYIEGAKGNDATCTAQGFFIQLSTIAGFINVSLSVYYLMIIKFGWNDDRLKKFRIWFYVCPIVTGLAFAFAGIPFYTNMILWCNNGAKWWPEIPVIISIIAATAVMAAVCVHVHKEEQASKRWRSAGNTVNRDSFSRAVFWQSIWYLCSFYLTWPPYLALQYVWSSGSYSAYGFVLFAGALVPMQGFWNCVAFKRNQIKRVINNVTKSLRSTTLRQTFSTANASGNSNRFSLMNTFKRSSQNPNRNFATADAASSKNTVSGTSTNILSEKSKPFDPSDTLQSGTIIDEAIPTNSPKVALEENSALAS